MDEFRGEGYPSNSNGIPTTEVSPSSSTTQHAMLAASSTSASSSSLSSLAPTEMVTRASMRSERKLKKKVQNDIYYFPSPSDKGKYPLDTNFYVDDKRTTARYVNQETMTTERNALKVLIRYDKTVMYCTVLCCAMPYL